MHRPPTRRRPSSSACWSAGRSTSSIPPRAGELGTALLRLRTRALRAARASSAGWQAPEDVSLDVRAGEIVGLAGIMGAGRTELLCRALRRRPARTLAGRRSRSTAGRRGSARSPAARRAGIAFVTDDRRGSGLMLRHGGRPQPRHVDPAAHLAARPDVAGARGGGGRALDPASSTSGRRAPTSRSATCRAATSRRWCSPRRCSASPRLLLLDEPTRGVDVGAKGEIYARLRELAAQGPGRARRVQRDAGADRASATGSSCCARGRTVAEFTRRRRRAQPCWPPPTASEDGGMSQARRPTAAGRPARRRRRGATRSRWLVRFQSLIGLVLVVDRRRRLLAAPAWPDPVPRARQHRQHRARRLRDRHHRASA